MSSLTHAAQGVVKLANAASIDYLVTLLSERTTEPIDASQFESWSQTRVSDMIDRALKRNTLPASPEQLALVAELAEKLGKGTIVTKDAGQASRQIRAMQADLAARSKRTITPERAEAADAALDSLLTGSNPVAPVVESDDIPF